MQTLSDLLLRCGMWPQTRRDVAIEYLARYLALVGDLLSSSSLNSSQLVQLFSNLIDLFSCYKTSLRPHSDKVRTQCWRFIAYSSPLVQRVAAQAIASTYLQTANSEQWMSGLEKMVDECHSLFNDYTSITPFITALKQQQQQQQQQSQQTQQPTNKQKPKDKQTQTTSQPCCTFFNLSPIPRLNNSLSICRISL